MRKLHSMYKVSVFVVVSGAVQIKSSCCEAINVA